MGGGGRGENMSARPQTRFLLSVSLCFQDIDLESISPHSVLSKLCLSRFFISETNILGGSFQLVSKGQPANTWQKYSIHPWFLKPCSIFLGTLHGVCVRQVAFFLDGFPFLLTSFLKPRVLIVKIHSRRKQEEEATSSQKFPAMETGHPNLATVSYLFPPIPLGTELNASMKCLLYRTQQISLFSDTGEEKENPHIFRKEKMMLPV